MIHLNPYPYIDVTVSAGRVELLRDAAYRAALRIVEHESLSADITDIRLEDIQQITNLYGHYALAHVKLTLK